MANMELERLQAQDERDLVELNSREADGIRVDLLWEKIGNTALIQVFDGRTGEEFEVSVAPDKAADAFEHPFAYAA
jgi:hypothetical protein